MRAINWEEDTTDEIICKVYAGDSHPGVLDEICGVKCYLFGVHKEDRLGGKPKEILAKRDGAICLGTDDGDGIRHAGIYDVLCCIIQPKPQTSS